VALLSRTLGHSSALPALGATVMFSRGKCLGGQHRNIGDIGRPASRPHQQPLTGPSAAQLLAPSACTARRLGSPPQEARVASCGAAKKATPPCEGASRRRASASVDK